MKQINTVITQKNFWPYSVPANMWDSLKMNHTVHVHLIQGASHNWVPH